MMKFEQYFQWPEVHIEHFFIYLFFAFVLAGYLVFKSKSKYKFELFFLSFYLLSGNINKLLTIKIPGISLFEIKPIRFIFLLLFFFIIRKILFSRERTNYMNVNSAPVFVMALIGFITFLTISVIYNSSDMEFGDVLLSIYSGFAFLVLIYGLSLMKDIPSYNLIGTSIIIGAVASSLVSIIQLSIDPYFLRIGDDRVAFGSVLRSNGIFSREYFNSYYLIIAITWTLISVKKNYLKYFLVGLFIIGILTSFQRMSWIILVLVLFTYFVFVKKLALDKLVLIALSGIALSLSISIFFYQDIVRSSLVQERLSDTIEGRLEYYRLAVENIDEKPLLGYGDLKNDVYYYNMLKITGNRERASAESGDLHSGYFSALFLYGIPASIFFSLFAISAVVYYSRLLKKKFVLRNSLLCKHYLFNW